MLYSRRTLLLAGAALSSLGVTHLALAAPAPNETVGPTEGTPDYALPPYDPTGAQIPADALDASDYPSVPAWLDAMQAEMRPGKIGSGTYDVTSVGRRRLLTSIYGYGETRPILRTATGPCILYLSANDITVQYLRVETPSMAFAYVDRGGNLIVTGEWRSADLEGAERAGSTALQHDSDISGIRFLDCEFGCVLPIAFMSQYHRISDIHIARNRALPGCAGFACLLSDRFSDIYIYQNDITGLNQGTLRGNHVGTALWVGSIVDNSPNFPSNLGVHIEYNRIENVTAAGTQANTNSGVGIDVRETSEAILRNNIVRNVVNSAGHVDSNGIYAKSNVLFENNLVENCGADARGRTTGEAGSEGSLLTFKGNSRCQSTIRNNIFVAGTRTDVPMILMSHTATLEGDRFEGWAYSGNYLIRDSMIRSYSGGPVLVSRPTFVNCGTAQGNPHRGYAMGEARGGNMMAEDFMVEFDGERTDIFNGDVAIENCVNLAGAPLVVGHDADTDAVMDAAATTLSQAQGVAMDFLVRDLKYRDIWPKLRALYLLHAKDTGMAFVDWHAPSRTITATGTPEFAAFSGYRATADGQKLSTGYNPVADGLPQDDCMMMVAVDGTDVRSNRNACGNAGLSLVLRNTTPADAHTARVATGAAISFAEPVASALGVHAVQRRASSTTVEHFKDGALLGTAASAAIAHHDSALTILARADVQGTAPYTVWAFAIGQSLTPQQHNYLRTALNLFRQAFQP